MTEPEVTNESSLPDVLKAATTADERELLVKLTDRAVDADDIARQLLTVADHDRPD